MLNILWLCNVYIYYNAHCLLSLYSASLTYLCELRDGIKACRYYTQIFLTVWKIMVFMACILVALKLQNDDPFSFFTKASEAFAERSYKIHQVSTLIWILLMLFIANKYSLLK